MKTALTVRCGYCLKTSVVLVDDIDTDGQFVRLTDKPPCNTCGVPIEVASRQPVPAVILAELPVE